LCGNYTKSLLTVTCVFVTGHGFSGLAYSVMEFTHAGASYGRRPRLMDQNYNKCKFVLCQAT